MIPRDKYFRFILSASFLIVCTMVFIPFMEYHQHKVLNGGGVDLHDPLLNRFPSFDLSLYIFIITYGAVLSFVIIHFREPDRMGKLMTAYGILLFLRMFSMTILPLNEPPGLVALNDPFLNELIYPGTITTDLFFSGHVGLLVLIAFLSRYRYTYLAAGAVLSVMLLFQHVHYTIDILVAMPVAIFVAWLVVKKGG